MREAAERMGMTQKQFNRLNKCSDILVAQKQKNNRGKGYECRDDSIGFNTCLEHISRYLKYGRSRQEQQAIDKQVQKARIAYYKEHRSNESAERSYSKKTVSTNMESLLTSQDRLNYKKMDEYIAKDKARAEKLANRKAKGSLKKSSSRTKSVSSVRYSVSRTNGRTGGKGKANTGGKGIGSGGKGIGSGHVGAHGGIGGAHTGGGHTGGGGKGGH